MPKKQTKKTITGWALQVTWSDGRDETILDLDDDTASAVDTFLTELEQERHEENKTQRFNALLPAGPWHAAGQLPGQL